MISPRFSIRERGTAVMELAAILPFMALLLSAVVAFGPFVHMRIAAQQAAYDCAFSAAQSLDPGQGFLQGMLTGQQSFRSFGLKSANATVLVRGSWGRGGQVTCTVTYLVPAAFPFKKIVHMPGSVQASVTLPVQQWKSEWR
jgi:Flp pilus assembly protein TadG